MLAKSTNSEKYKERVKAAPDNTMEIKACVDEALYERAKELYATNSVSELLEAALEALIAKKEKDLGKIDRTFPEKHLSTNNPESRYIPAAIRRAIHNRSQGQCATERTISISDSGKVSIRALNDSCTAA